MPYVGTDDARAQQERSLDEALAATFPASDPIAVPRASLAIVEKRCARDVRKGSWSYENAAP